MNPKPIEDAIKLVNHLWEGSQGPTASVTVPVSRAAELAFDAVRPVSSAWHGYGWREDKSGFVFTPFVEVVDHLAPIVQSISTLLSDSVPNITVEGLVVPRFHQMQTGIQKPLPTALQPGNIVFAGDSKDCPFSCAGTIAAFLVGGKQPDTWLLTNHHVLAECRSASKASGANDVVIGTDIRPVPVSDTGNLVDAALVKIDDTSKINRAFDPLGPVKNPGRDIQPLQQGDIVRKLGAATQVRYGEFILRCPRVTVFDCSDTKPREFQDQLAFISTGNDGVFAEEGDSGSLVIHGEIPVGLLFAKTVRIDAQVLNGQTFKPPFFLANPWDSVIQALENVVEGPLQLLL